MRTESLNITPPNVFTCFLCGEPKPHCLGGFEGVAIEAWNVVVCRSCEADNPKGFPPHIYPKLLPYLRDRGIEPERIDGYVAWPRQS